LTNVLQEEKGWSSPLSNRQQRRSRFLDYPFKGQKGKGKKFPFFLNDKAKSLKFNLFKNEICIKRKVNIKEIKHIHCPKKRACESFFKQIFLNEI
jgi:hypothetical protein